MDGRDNGIAHDTRAQSENRHWIADVVVEPKPGVNDPQGDAILGGLQSLGYENVRNVRSGRFFRLRLSASDEAAARLAVASMCEKLLANPVIETYSVTAIEAAAMAESAGNVVGGEAR